MAIVPAVSKRAQRNGRPTRLELYEIRMDGVPLKAAIDLHREFSQGSRRGGHCLKGNIGDGFLYATNPVFRHIRDEYLRLNFTFTLRDRFGYYACPMMSLESLYAAKAIPYRDNFSSLVRLDQRTAGRLTLNEVQHCGLKFNYVMHESAHFIAHTKLFGSDLIKISKTRDSLLKIIIGESFANSAELLSFIFSVRDVGGFFLQANSYVIAPGDRVARLREISSEAGFAVVAKISFAYFCYLNFLYQNLEKKHVGRIAIFAGVPTRGTLVEKVIATIGPEALNPKFRAATTPLYLRSIGFESHLSMLQTCDPLETLLETKNSKILKSTRQLLETMCGKDEPRIWN